MHTPWGLVRIRVKLVRPFRDAVGQPQVEFEPREPGLVGALRQLAEAYPGLQPHLFENGQLSPYVNIYVNAEAVHVDEAAKVTLQDGDEVLFLLPLTGG